MGNNNVVESMSFIGRKTVLSYGCVITAGIFTLSNGFMKIGSKPLTVAVIEKPNDLWLFFLNPISRLNPP